MLNHGEIGQILKLNVAFPLFSWMVAELASYVLIHGKIGSTTCVSSLSISLDQFDRVSSRVCAASLSGVLYLPKCTLLRTRRDPICMVSTQYD